MKRDPHVLYQQVANEAETMRIEELIQDSDGPEPDEQAPEDPDETEEIERKVQDPDED